MEASALDEILTGGYAGQIQDLLGNRGSAVQINIGAASTSVSRGITAIGAAWTQWDAPATILSFSPAAQTALSGAAVALSVITATQSGRDAPGAAVTRATPGQQTLQTTSPPPPTHASLTNILNQAKAALADPSQVFYQVIEHTNGPEQFARFFSDPAQRQSFVDAYDNHSLTIQNASDVNGLSYQNTTVLTGTSETFSASIDERWRNQQDASAGTYSTDLNFPVIGGLYVTWPKPA